ncbi:hypothetical protein ACRQ5Q_39985 [Bradyrhizobium sp. PMVTL-01]|uniref:hypothetical protein n=1 Tax=Bradyrhizobium sp. PMVTL-01 TaxID=3434999 RepID=UPI003F712002
MLPARAQQVPLQDKPFAQHEIVLQLSDVGEYWSPVKPGDDSGGCAAARAIKIFQILLSPQ